MFGKDWQTSRREYDVVVERDFEIPVGDGVTLAGELYRPEGDDSVPVILSASAYNTPYQSAEITPRGSTSKNAWIEAGDPRFLARRGYAHAIVNVRGTGGSSGRFRNRGPREIADLVEAIEWLADRPWCDGSASMMGISYFGIVQIAVAMHDPDPLEAIFAPWAAPDPYRHGRYHGGICQHGFLYKWANQLDNPRFYNWSKHNLSDEEYERRIQAALADEEIRAHDFLVEALENPEDGMNTFFVDNVINNLDEEGGYFDERRPSFENTETPAYLGASWDHIRTHLPGAFANWRHWDGPKKLLVGPPNFVDRPFYQLGYESLRWFDYWLKDVDTGIMDEPPVRLFLMGAGTWTAADEWPLAETKWTPFYLHEDGVLSEKEYLPNEGYTTFEDSPFGRGSVRFWTPELYEQTEVIGPVLLDLYASTTDEEVLFFVDLLKRGPSGEETVLSKGWLRGSQRKVDPERSEPWRVHHPHDERETVPPNTPVNYQINVRPTGVQLAPGERLGVEVRSADAAVGDEYYDIAQKGIQAAMRKGRHLSRQSPSRVTIYHDAEHPSRLHVPVTAGNVVGTYYAGTEATYDETVPYNEIQARKHTDDDPT